MTKRILLVLLASLAIGVQAFAQTVSGKVADANGEAIPGASVIVKGTTTGTMTDLDGAYAINAGSNATLVFSCIGYQTQEVAVGGKGTINVVLTEDSTLLEETVVIAYGTAKKKDLTGSIGTVDGSAIAIQAQGSVTRALEGQVAGLQTSAGDGQPGLDMGIRVRGIGTANANNSNALIIVDGAPAIEGTNPLASINSKDIESITVLKDAASTALYGSRGANGVILVTTKSGKSGKAKVSFEARWGANTVSDLANGRVHNIGDNNVGDWYEMYWLSIYNAVYTGFGSNTEALKGNKAASAEFASKHLFDYKGDGKAFGRNGLYNRLAYNVPGMQFIPSTNAAGDVVTGGDASSTLGGAYLVGIDGKLNPNAQILYQDGALQDELLKARFRQEYNASVSGGSDKIDYYVSLGYLNDPSYVATSGFDRYSARVGVNAQVTDWLKAGAKLSYTNRKTNSLSTRYGRNPGSNAENPFARSNSSTDLDQAYARDLNGNWIYDKDGNRLGQVNWGSTAYMATPTLSPVGPTRNLFSQAINWVEYYKQQLDSVKNDDIVANGYLRAKFLKYFTAEVNLTYNTTFQTRTRYWNDETANARLSGVGSAIHQDKEQYSTITTQQLINYAQDIQKHHVDAMVGHEYYQYDYDLIRYGSGMGLVNGFMGYSNFLGTRSGGTFGNSSGGNINKYAMESYFGRANYIYDNKYYVSASLRRDGSSKFKKPENRWGTFWSVGAGWRISSEPWMEGAKGWLDNLKVRASYGVLGNQNGIGMYSGYQTWSYGASGWAGSNISTYPTGITLSKGTWTNDALTWENVHTTDAGIDFTLFGGKVSGTFDWFNKQTVNAAWAQNVSYLAAGQATVDMNTAGIRSRGIEIELSYQPVKTKDWDVILSVNGTHYNNILTSVPEGTGSEALNGCWTAGSDGWSIVDGGSSSSGYGYLRGVGKDYYNMYLFHYAGVAGNTGITYYGKDGKQYTGYKAGDPYAGYPLFTHVVTADEAKAGKYGSAKAGDWINTTVEGDASRVELGDALPDFYGGFNLNVRYKGIDLGVMTSFQIGGKFFSREYAGFGDEGRYSTNYINSGVSLSQELWNNTWTEENVDAKFPRVVYGGTLAMSGTSNGADGFAGISDMALFDASYFSIKNVTLGYTFPKKWMDKVKIANLRVYASADNPVLIYGHKGIDPRWSIVGNPAIGPFTYPYLTVYTFGINLDF